MDELLTIFADMGFTAAEGRISKMIPQFHGAELSARPSGAADARTRSSCPMTRTPRASARRSCCARTPPPCRSVTCCRTSRPSASSAWGRTYRSENDMTHTPMFHQIEGLVIDRVTTMAHLKGCMLDFVRAYFEIDDLPLRFPPELLPLHRAQRRDRYRLLARRRRAKNRSGDRWMEIGGCGMVHPNVLRNCGLDPDDSRASPSAWASSGWRC